VSRATKAITLTLREQRSLCKIYGSRKNNSLSLSVRRFSKKPTDTNASFSRKVQQPNFLQKWMGPTEIPPRWTLRWYGEMTLICTVFAISGTSTMVLVRPAMNEILGLRGSMREGPWSYRLCSLFIMTPVYPFILITVGTTFGRHAYFRHFAVKMFSRFGIPPEMIDKNFYRTAKTFRKW